MRNTRRRIGAGIAVLGVALALSGCTPGPNVAVQSMGVSYTEQEIDEAMPELQELFGGQQQITRDVVISTIVMLQPMFNAFEESGLATQEQGVALAGQSLAQAGINIEDYSPITQQILAFGQLQAAQQMLAQQDPTAIETITENMTSPVTKVNPRYGSFDPQQGLVPYLGDVAAAGASQAELPTE